MGISFMRTIIIFALLVISMRIMGKRQLGELEPIELAVAVLISNMASQPLQDIGTPLAYGLVPVLTLLACQVLISGLTVKNLRLRRLICGKSSILIHDGQIVQSEMKKTRLSLEELFVELRGKDVTDISTVKHAILETNGKLSVLLYPAEAPATPKQMSLTVDDPGLPVTVISDGRVLSDNLRLMGYNEKWLGNQLALRKTANASDVYLMTVDGLGRIYFARKEGNA